MSRADCGDAKRPRSKQIDIIVKTVKPVERGGLSHPEGDESGKGRSDAALLAAQRFQVSENRIGDYCRDQRSSDHPGDVRFNHDRTHQSIEPADASLAILPCGAPDTVP
jgi:hypothetical protein